jgi:drug/metabolite transporter (DMT)-like permease
MPLPQSHRLEYSRPVPDSLDWRVVASLAFTLVLWASAFAAIRFCLRPGAYEPGHLALLRFLVASLTMLVCCIFVKVRLPVMRDVPTFFAMGFLGVALYHAALNYGQTTVGAGAASFLINTAPAFTALLALLVLKEKMRLWGWLGIALSMAGIFVIASGKKGGLQFDPNAFFIVLSALGASIHMILNKQILQRYTPLESTTFTILCGTLFLLVFSPGLLAGVAHAPRSATLVAIYIGVFPAALAYVSWAHVLSRLPASQTATFLYLMPGLAIMIAWLWLDEVPHIATLIGGAMALAGVILVNTYGKVKLQSIRVTAKK